MQKIQIKNGIIGYYGNAVGYVENGVAILDPMFQNNELIKFLQEKEGLDILHANGVYDKLANGVHLQNTDNSSEMVRLKDCRIWQLKPDVDPTMKFIGYDELIKNGFNEPNIDNYNVVYDGEVATNNLECIYQKFNMEHPHDYKGHSLSLSDIIELYDSSGSSFHYVDRFGFKEVDFAGQEQAKEIHNDMNQSM